MPSWTSTWLSGLEAAGVTRAPDDWRGKKLGLPAEGIGAVASFNARLGAVLADLFVAGLLGAMINLSVTDPGLVAKQAAGIGALVGLYVVLLPWTRRTPGMALAGIAVQRLDGRRLNPVAALLRGVLVALTLPALFTDRQGRGLHDKLVGSVVVRTRD